jgi:hypothetical protein
MPDLGGLQAGLVINPQAPAKRLSTPSGLLIKHKVQKIRKLPRLKQKHVLMPWFVRIEIETETLEAPLASLTGGGRQ